jgi:hypothetical protein
MIFGGDRDELRAMYAQAWQKHRERQPLSPLEAQIARVIEEHPEFHAALGGPLDGDYTIEAGEANPFLHMGLHLGIREQVATDRPAGIATVHARLAAKSGDAHAAEHRMIDVLAQALWEAQRQNSLPDESRYLDQLRRLLG